MKQFIPLVVMLALSLSFTVPTFAQDDQPNSPGQTPGQTREKKIQMLEQAAKAHQAAANCLKAGKPESECRAAMKKNMPMKGDMQGCPMMDGHQMMKGGSAPSSHHDQNAAPDEAAGE